MMSTGWWLLLVTAACQKIESNIKVINALSCIVLSFVSVRLIELLKLLIYIQFFKSKIIFILMARFKL